MKRAELACQLSEEARLTHAEARDQVDEVVRGILKSLRKGTPVELPGVGRLVSKKTSRKSGKR